MSCPDEDTYASFLQGLLAPERVATIERHIDGCPRCTELSAEFGKLYSGDGAPGPAAAPERPAAAAPAPAVLSSGGARAGAGGGGLALVEAAMTAIHVAFALVALPAALHAWTAPGRAAAGGAGAAIALGIAAYVIAWVPLGGAVTATAALGLWRRRSWARRIARLHALLSLPSIVLTPLAAYVLYRLSQPLESK